MRVALITLFSAFLFASAEAVAAPDTGAAPDTDTVVEPGTWDWSEVPETEAPHRKNLYPYVRSYLLEGRCLYSDPSKTAQDWSRRSYGARAGVERHMGSSWSGVTPLFLANCSQEINATYKQTLRKRWYKKPVTVLMVGGTVAIMGGGIVAAATAAGDGAIVGGILGAVYGGLGGMAGVAGWELYSPNVAVRPPAAEVVKKNCSREGWECGMTTDTPFRFGRDRYSVLEVEGHDTKLSGKELVEVLVHARAAQGGGNRSKPMSVSDWAETLSFRAPTVADIAAESPPKQKPVMDVSFSLSKESEGNVSRVVKSEVAKVFDQFKTTVEGESDRLNQCVKANFSRSQNYKTQVAYSIAYDSTSRKKLSTKSNRKDSRVNRCLQQQSFAIVEKARADVDLSKVNGRYTFDVKIAVKPDVWAYSLKERLEQQEKVVAQHEALLKGLVNKKNQKKELNDKYAPYLAPTVWMDLAVYFRTDLQDKLDQFTHIKNQYSRGADVETCKEYSKQNFAQSVDSVEDYAKRRSGWRETHLQERISWLTDTMADLTQSGDLYACEKALKATYAILKVGIAADTKEKKAKAAAEAKKPKRKSRPTKSCAQVKHECHWYYSEGLRMYRGSGTIGYILCKKDHGCL